MRAVPLLVLALVASGCVADDAPSLPTTGAELVVDAGPERAFEPDVAIDPADPSHWLVGSTVFGERGAGGSPSALRSHVTFDGGRTWTNAPFPGEIASTHPLAVYTQSADPAVAILPDGTAVYAGMAATGSTATRDAAGVNTFRPFDIFVARSADGGRTWPEATIVARGSGLMGPLPALPREETFLAGVWPDNPWLAVGPEGELLLTWQRREASGGTHAYTAMASVSRDGGRTWAEPTAVHDGPGATPRPAVAEDGTLWVAFRDVTREDRTVWVSTSTDRGASWRATQVPDTITRAYVDLAVGHGALHLTVVPPPVDGVETPHLLRSTDGGATWRAVALEGASAPGWSLPRVAAMPGGAVVTHFHALAEDANEYRAVFVSGEGDVRSVRLSATPIGASDTTAGWPSRGDYMGLDATSDGFVAVWVGGAGRAYDLFATSQPWPGVP